MGKQPSSNKRGIARIHELNGGDAGNKDRFKEMNGPVRKVSIEEYNADKAKKDGKKT